MVGEFDNFSNFAKENIRTWTFNYVNLNNNILNIVIEAREEIIEIEKQMLDMKIKWDKNVPSLWDYIIESLEKLLVPISKAD